MPIRLLVDDDQLIAMDAAGMSPAEICEASNKITGNNAKVNSVSRALGRLGRSSPVRYNDTFPWKNVPDVNGHGNSHIAHMLRAQGRRARGLELSEKTQRALDSWEEEMDEQRMVVEYIYFEDANDVDEPGFRYRHWQPQDGDNWVRIVPLPLYTTKKVPFPVDRRSKFHDPEPVISQRQPESVWAGGLFSGISG